MNSASAGPERERGWSDVSLDAAGRKEALRTSAKLSKLGIRALLSSDLKRAKQTADIISDYLGIKPEFESGLRTWDTGTLAGRLKRDAEPIIRRLVRDNPDEAPKGGESFDQFCNRIRSCLVDIFKTHTENPMAIVIHHRVERLLEAAGDDWKHIDVDKFLAQGENPGTVEKWTVNPSALSSGSRKFPRASVSIAAHANTSRADDATTRTSS